MTVDNRISEQSRAGMPDEGLGIAARVVDAFASGHWIEEEGLGLSVGALPRNEKPKRRGERNGDKLPHPFRLPHRRVGCRGENVIEHLAGVEDLQVAKATYLAACQRWPGTPMTLRQGTRVIEESRQTRIV
jgi:hypothetical protein